MTTQPEPAKKRRQPMDATSRLALTYAFAYGWGMSRTLDVWWLTTGLWAGAFWFGWDSMKDVARLDRIDAAFARLGANLADIKGTVAGWGR